MSHQEALCDVKKDTEVTLHYPSPPLLHPPPPPTPNLHLPIPTTNMDLIYIQGCDPLSEVGYCFCLCSVDLALSMRTRFLPVTEVSLKWILGCSTYSSHPSSLITRHLPLGLLLPSLSTLAPLLVATSVLSTHILDLSVSASFNISLLSLVSSGVGVRHVLTSLLPGLHQNLCRR